MGSSESKVPGGLRKELEEKGQAQVLDFVDRKMLSAAETKALVKQLKSIDVSRANELFTGSTAEKPAGDEKVTPVDPSEVVSVAKAVEQAEKWSELAYERMSKGQVAFLVLSGGQGTRLGFDRAKGIYDISLPSSKTLFQLQGERLLKLHELVKAKYPEAAAKGTVRIPWYIMTSPLNDEDTRGYFKENNYFGLSEKDVVFFQQGTLPCMTNEGKFILQRKDKVASAPDGNGGIYLSMKNTGVLKAMEGLGVEYIHVTSVDNALVKVADPVFMGCCIEKEAEVGNKGCPKVSWDEKVGVLALKGGEYNIVEYSELEESMAKATSEDGRLLFSTGNICNHFFTLSFIRDKAIPALSASYHIAHKKIPFADPETGETVKPTANNGIKLELFIFDVFPLTKKMGVFECDRQAEFAPVKNAPGEKSDSPDSARNMTFALHKSWLEAAGAKVEVEGENAEVPIEVTPRVSYGGEGLEEIVASVSSFKAPMLLCREDEPSFEVSADAKVVSAEGKDKTVKHFVTDAGVNVYVVQK